VGFAAAVKGGGRVGGEGEEPGVVVNRSGEVAAGVLDGGAERVGRGLIRREFDRVGGEGEGAVGVAGGEGLAGGREEGSQAGRCGKGCGGDEQEEEDREVAEGHGRVAHGAGAAERGVPRYTAARRGAESCRRV